MRGYILLVCGFFIVDVPVVAFPTFLSVKRIKKNYSAAFSLERKFEDKLDENSKLLVVDDEEITRENDITGSETLDTVHFDRKTFLIVTSTLALLGVGASNAESQLSHSGNQVAPAAGKGKTIEQVDIQKVIQENKIQITVYENNTKVSLNSTSFEKIRETRFDYLPKFLRPNLKPQISGISDKDILLASATAGAFSEILRTCILYPVMTIKTRVQVSTPSNSQGFRNKIRDFAKSLIVQTKAGSLFTGILPTLIIGAPSSGLYYGVSDVTKRELRASTQFDELSIVLLAVFVADIISLAFRTPALIFSVRKQAEKTIDFETVEDFDENGNVINILEADGELEFSEEETLEAVKERVNDLQNNWWGEFSKDCLRQLPVIIATDLPYLLVKITLLRSLAHGSENMIQYDVLNIISATVASGLTTPFDVIRTRILVDSDNDPTNGLDGGSGESIVQAMRTIVYESGAPKFQNLYAGWFERIFYYGVGIAWLEPIRVICYYGIRDTILLDVLQ